MSGRGVAAALFRPVKKLKAPKHWRTIMLAAAIFASFTAAGVMVGRAAPVTRHVTVNRHVVMTQIKRVKRVYISVPTGQKFAPLSDPKMACKGAPVVIIRMSVAGWQGQAENDKSVKTWLTVRPAGDTYTVQCNMAGDYSDAWNEGDLVVLLTGEVSG